MVTDGSFLSQYDPSRIPSIIAETAALVKGLGFAAGHIVLIGGIVPGLLVPQLDPGIEPHAGTNDIDFCLSAAIVDGDTAEYERIEQSLIRLGFKPMDSSWRWRGGSTGTMVVEFFCPLGEGRAPGKIFRPRQDVNPRSKHNLGASLSAIPLETGSLLTRDVIEFSREVELPRGQGRATVPLRVTGLGAFLASKASALRLRDKPKDAYDIVWILNAWAGGPDGAAGFVREGPIWGSPELKLTFDVLADYFRDLDSAGSIAYARFVAPGGVDVDREARFAVGVLAAFLSRIRQGA